MAGANGGESYDINSLLSSKERDFLIRNNGDQVKIADLNATTLGLYFSASWCGPCRNFTPKLAESYNELSSQNKGFEIVFISGDEDQDSFNSYFSKMPWLAIPFSESEKCKKLNELFKVMGIPTLVIIDGKTGNLQTTKAVQFVREHGTEAYPFTPERFKELKELEEEAKRNQTLKSVLASPARDYVISNKGDKVPISDLEGKLVGLYFFIPGYASCSEFTSILTQIYEKVNEKEKQFEIVTVPLDMEEASFNESITCMPWLALPFKDESCEKLVRYFELRSLPTLVMIGTDGKTINPNAADVIEELELEALEGFPFSEEKLGILEEKVRAKVEKQTLESLLVAGELDYVVGKEGTKVSVSDLVGKTVLLYFSAQWCGPCRAFLPKLIEEYNKIKSKHSDFEIIFISSDRDESSYAAFYSSMPWLALPFEDSRKKFLKKTFKIKGIPSLIAIGPTGKTISDDAKQHLMLHGADAYPFTEERIKELEEEMEKLAKTWPEKVKHELHEEHELILTKCGMYGCDGCSEMGHGWSYRCVECNFDLHTKCALEKDEVAGNGEDDGKVEGEGKEGYVCEGDVCRKV